MFYLLQVKLDEVIIVMKLIKKKLIFNTNEHNLDQSDQYILMAQAPICSSAF